MPLVVPSLSNPLSIDISHCFTEDTKPLEVIVDVDGEFADVKPGKVDPFFKLHS